jgi:hypothetical protein
MWIDLYVRLLFKAQISRKVLMSKILMSTWFFGMVHLCRIPKLSYTSKKMKQVLMSNLIVVIYGEKNEQVN